MDDGIDFPGYAAKPAVETLAVTGFDRLRAAWIEGADGGEGGRDESIKCATFNTWFQGGDAAVRHAGLLACLQRANADVIVLQETTMQLLGALRASPWVQERYRYVRAPFRDDAIPSHGLMLLSRFPIVEAKLYPLRTYMGRRLLVARCRVNGAPFVFATAHLESMKRYGDVRADQLAAIFGILEDAPDAVLAGDFNFCSSDKEENARLDARFQDLWPILRPGDPGYTQDTEANLMLALAKGERKQVRIDRILHRCTGPAPLWRAVSIELLGTEPVDAARRKVFPSDHFGLAATLRLAG